MRTLVLFFHPALERSRVNRRLLDAALSVSGVEVRDEYELYPDFDVDVQAEQAALQKADAIVFQHPFFWYSGPALLKQWQDVVLEFGWAYGTGGVALRGKLGMHAISTGGGLAAYRPGGYNRFTLREFMRPLEQTAGLCGIRFAAPFISPGTHHMDDATLEERVQSYTRLLEGLRDDRLDVDAATQAELFCPGDALPLAQEVSR